MLYWYFAGAIYLFILAVQDIRNKTLVDDRHNYFMFGVTFALVMFKPPAHWWYLLSIFLMISISFYMFTKKGYIGQADANTFIWLFVGLAILDIFSLVLWCAFFIPLYIIYRTLAYFLQKKHMKLPLYPILFLSWLLFIIAM